MTLALARGVQHTLRLLLAGVVVGVVLGACTSLILLLSPDSLQAMQGVLLGSTGFVGWTSCLLLLAVWLPCLAAAWALARALDALAWARPPRAQPGPAAWRRCARRLVAVLALATGTAVAQTG